MKAYYLITQCALCGAKYFSQETHTEEQVASSREILKDMGGSNLLDLHDCADGNKGTLIVVGYAPTSNIKTEGAKQ